MTPLAWVTFGLGVWVGLLAGRWFTEVLRARFDRKRIWRKRKDYRDLDNLDRD